MIFNTRKAPHLVLDYFCAALTRRRLEVGRPAAQPAASGLFLRADDGAARGSASPVAWAPRSDPAQLELVERNLRISTVIGHDGWWKAFILDVNDEQECMTVGSTRAEAVMRTALVATFGEQLHLQDEFTLGYLLAQMTTQQDEPVWGSLSEAAVEGVAFPVQLWEIRQVSAGGVSRYLPGPIVAKGATRTAAGRLQVRCEDSEGMPVRMEPRDLFISAAAAVQRCQALHTRQTEAAPATDEALEEVHAPAPRG